ncbi:hypothetical protein Y1Q_0023165 [Alligator mississippiensis]|uniref:Uncharacterized protein n=1 Tax=Alligator mississippiensis TaxID=8496 RepID=A0A151MZ56_ALLMI|nr:hypothetical protein Y1Q_0023165 [Alligator mississippiensis]
MAAPCQNLRQVLIFGFMLALKMPVQIGFFEHCHIFFANIDSYLLSHVDAASERDLSCSSIFKLSSLYAADTTK